MGINFNIDETLQMAIKIEQNGRSFYLKAADNTSDKTAKKVFKDLADMEGTHEDYFKKLKEQLTAKEKQQDTYDPENESVAYLNAFAGGHVFTADQKLSGKETAADVLKTAIGLEKDSIVFYLGIKAIVPENLGKAKVEGIIQEEMTHIRILSERLKAL